MFGRKKELRVKKNKGIEVNVEENGNIHTLTIGKKTVGTVEKISDRKFIVKPTGEKEQNVKSFEAGYEELIRYWNLFQQ